MLIHDGARPFLTEKLIEDGIEAAVETGAAAAAVEVKDTIKQVDDSGYRYARRCSATAEGCADPAGISV